MSERKVSNFVCTVTLEQSEALRQLLENRGWSFAALNFGRYRALGEQVSVAVYNSGKLTVQGSGTADFVEFILEPEILHSFSFGQGSGAVDELIEPHGGVDESGKGDFFGPLCIAGVYVDAESGAQLRKIGCCDSKLIKSSNKILELAGEIRRIVYNRFTVVNIPPETYNRLYAKIGNLNRLLAWGHARVIENLLERVPDCPRMLSDKFGDESLIKRALMTRGKGIVLDQRTKAESDVAVAAASILAREQFLSGMEKLSNEFGVTMPRGAGPLVKEIAKSILQKHGAPALSRCVKTHFKTYNELTTGISNN